MPTTDNTGIDWTNSIVNDSIGLIDALKPAGGPTQSYGPIQPAVSVGIAGQSSTLIILAIVVIGAVWIATKK